MVLSYFKKAGSFSVVKQYIKNHVFIYALCLFLIIPKNRKGLEIFNECMTLKIYSKLKRKYMHQLETFSFPEEIIKPKIIWFCWLQGIEKAPKLVQVVLKSIQKQLPDYEIKLLTANNYAQYTNIPDYITNKWIKGVISNTHFSDILRTNVLINQGGTWIDSTAFLTGAIPEDIEKASIFFFRTFKPGSLGHILNSSNWFISSCKDNPVLKTIQSFLYTYWKKNNSVKDYFIYHMYTEIAFDTYPTMVKKMPMYSNEAPHFLFYMLNDEFDKDKFDMVKRQSFVHKLSNKYIEQESETETMFSHILNKEVFC